VKLILVRHGQTSSNVDGLLDTAIPGASLTDLGRRQAEALVELFAGEVIGSVSASHAVRTQQTAAPLAASRGLTVQVRDGLKEVAAGDWEMSGDREAVDGWLSAITAWMDGDLDARTPGPDGESGRDCLTRYDRALAGLAAELGARPDQSGAAHVVVSHGAIIRTWASLRSDNLDAHHGAAHPLSNTAVVRLTGTPDDGWIWTAWGETEHEVETPAAADPTAEVLPAT
jgi:broad specificity phosphatase PhoE